MADEGMMKESASSSMEEGKRGDWRIYVVYVLFFGCTSGGGALLCLYLFQDESQTQTWNPALGLALVAVPWVFWFFVYIYKFFVCLLLPQGQAHHSHGGSSRRAVTPAAAPRGDTANHLDEESAEPSPRSGGDRRVRFGAVSVMGRDGGANRSPHPRESSEEENSYDDPFGSVADSRESQRPLAPFAPSL